MIPTVSLNDILAIFLAGVFVGMFLTAYLTHKTKQYFKRNSAKEKST